MTEAWKTSGKFGLFPDWKPPAEPAFLRMVSKSNKRPFLKRMAMIPNLVAEVIADGLEQLLPFVIWHMESPHQLRRRYGRSNWRKIHAGSGMTNYRRIQVLQKRPDDMRVFNVAPGLLPLIVRQVHEDEVWFVCLNNSDRHGIKPAVQSYSNYWLMLLRDIRRAESELGVERLDLCSMRSLVQWDRYHDSLVELVKEQRHSPVPFPHFVPFLFESDGMHFELLGSAFDIAHEGKEQNHCVAIYAGQARRQECYIFRQTGAQRATLMIDPAGFILQHYRKRNRDVSVESSCAAVDCTLAFTRKRFRDAGGSWAEIRKRYGMVLNATDHSIPDEEFGILVNCVVPDDL
jgi:hypothetical protein